MIVERFDKSITALNHIVASNQNFEQMAQQPHDTLQIFLISCHATPTSCPLGLSKTCYINLLYSSTNFIKNIIKVLY